MAAEKNFENKIKKYLKDHDCWFIKYWAGAQFTKNGIPDILACVNGHFLAIEVKALNGKPSDLQIYNIDQINNLSNGIAIVLYPDQFDLFTDLVTALIRNYGRNAVQLCNKINSQKPWYKKVVT